MEIQRTDIDKHLHSAIAIAHTERKDAVARARNSINAAFEKTARVGALIEKAQQIHSQDLFGFMAEHMTAEEVKQDLSFYDAYRKRGELMDKRLLTQSGIWEQKQMEYMRDVTPKPSPGLVRTTSSFVGKFNKILGKRPAEEWPASEREQVKDVLKPVADFYNSL